MRTSYKLKLAWPALLKLAEKGSVSIFYRGVDENDNKLYELRTKELFEATAGIETEPQLLDRLIGTKEAT